MTCEVAILNRNAVALAADSAMTVTYWDKGESRTRFYKSANKIFNLSNQFPVGLMVYSSAAVNGVSWETVSKEFRKENGDKSKDHLDEYMKSFIDFLQDNQVLFSQKSQEDRFVKECMNAVYIFLYKVIHSDDFKKKRKDTTRKRHVDFILRVSRYSLSRRSLLSGCTPEDVQDAIQKFKDLVSQKIKSDIIPTFPFPDVDLLSDFAIKSVFSNFYDSLSSTGLVLVGFGEKEVFPSLLEFTCYGVVLGKVMYSVEPIKKIEDGDDPIIKGFAQTGMVDTFLHGINNDVYADILNAFGKSISEFESKLKDKSLLAKGTNLKSLKDDIEKNFFSSIIDKALDQNTYPLRTAVNSLPIDEMAELAESMISLQSLKERVTKHTDSVGGPIDVAVISKGDGFIWIKRKHYFERELNPRYFGRINCS